MAGKLALVRRLPGVEGIHILKVWRRGVQPLSVDDQMPVRRRLHAVTGQRDQPFDVKTGPGGISGVLDALV